MTVEDREAVGAELPQFVTDKFDALLQFGILAHGFLRLRFGDAHLLGQAVVKADETDSDAVRRINALDRSPTSSATLS